MNHLESLRLSCYFARHSTGSSIMLFSPLSKERLGTGILVLSLPPLILLTRRACLSSPALLVADDIIKGRLLVSIKKMEGESLHAYLNCFNMTTLEVHKLDPFMTMMALKRRLQRCTFLFSLERGIRKILQRCLLGQTSMPMLRHTIPIQSPPRLSWKRRQRV